MAETLLDAVEVSTGEGGMGKLLLVFINKEFTTIIRQRIVPSCEKSKRLISETYSVLNVAITTTLSIDLLFNWHRFVINETIVHTYEW